MSRTSRNRILLLALMFVALLGLSGRAFASSTATITVNGAETSGDTNTITVSFNSFTETVRYGQFSTQASLASAFAAMFSRDYLPAGLCANASGNVINFKLKGAETFGPLSVTGSTASFQLTSSEFLATGSPVADTGTVTLSINGTVAATAHYGYGATPAIVAQELADGTAGNSLVTVTAVNDALYIESKTAGAGTDYSYSVQNAGYNHAFNQPSFPASPISGNLDGGADGSTGQNPKTVYSYSTSYDPAGNLLGYTDNGSGGHPNGIMGSWSFTYDTLNRLTTATVAANAPAPYANSYVCWNYDSFGNRTVQSLQSSSCPAQSASTWVYSANNQVTGVIPPGGTQPSPSPLTYDPSGSGNVIADAVAGNQYLYDGEGRICAVSSPSGLGGYVMTGYLYDADGTRVAKGRISAWSCDPAVNGFQTTSDYILGPGGEQVTEMGMDANNSMAWQHTNVYAGGSLIATYDNDGLHFYFNDPLGTRRAQTDYAGVLEQTCSSLPFGDGLSCSGGNLQAPTEHHFTGKERDTESGNDYFGARYYASSMGRWMSPDWSAKVELVPYANLEDPQSLNLYSYVQDNPLSKKDPDGHCDVDVGGGKTEHHWGWCIFHTLGFYQTQPEMHKEAEMWRHTLGKLPGMNMDDMSDADVLHGMHMVLATMAPDVPPEAAAAEVGSALEITAQDGTKITGFAGHGVDRAIGEGAQGVPGVRAGTKPEAILDALKNPKSIKSGVDSLGRPYRMYTGQNARVLVNPQTGKIFSVNPTSGAGAH